MLITCVIFSLSPMCTKTIEDKAGRRRSNRPSRSDVCVEIREEISSSFSDEHERNGVILLDSIERPGRSSDMVGCFFSGPCCAGRGCCFRVLRYGVGVENLISLAWHETLYSQAATQPRDHTAQVMLGREILGRPGDRADAPGPPA